MNDAHVTEIQNELDSISNQIDKLYDRQHELNAQMRKYYQQYYTELFNSLMLNEYDLLITINPCVGYHDDVVTIWKITNREPTFQNFDVLETVFRVDDYEASTRIRNQTITYASLESLIENYDLYTLSADADISSLLNHIYNPKYDNYMLSNELINDIASKSKVRSIHKNG